ncbi:hypothetical protein Emed_000343 [Eimeria media]
MKKQQQLVACMHKRGPPSPPLAAGGDGAAAVGAQLRPTNSSFSEGRSALGFPHQSMGAPTLGVGSPWGAPGWLRLSGAEALKGRRSVSPACCWWWGCCVAAVAAAAAAAGQPPLFRAPLIKNQGLLLRAGCRDTALARAPPQPPQAASPSRGPSASSPPSCCFRGAPKRPLQTLRRCPLFPVSLLSPLASQPPCGMGPGGPLSRQLDPLGD